MELSSAECESSVTFEPRRRGGFGSDASRVLVDLQPVADVFALLIAAYASIVIYGAWTHKPMETLRVFESSALTLAVLAPFVLFDQQLNQMGSRASTRLIIRRTMIRFLRLAGVALALGFATRSTDILPRMLAMLWFACGLILVTGSRVGLAKQLQVLEHRGMFKDSVAVVGSGPIADRVIRTLQQTASRSVEIVGVFDDRRHGGGSGRTTTGLHIPVGTIEDLIKLGQLRKIDWVLLAMPNTAENRLNTIVHSLKALAVSVGLCPENIGMSLPYRMINYLGDGFPVTLLADRPIRNWNAVLKSAEDLVLGGLLTLLLFPLMVIVAVAIRLDSPGPILYRQRRHAANNSEFEVLKFRTMRWNPDSDKGILKQTGVDDDRVTRVGRFLRKSSLDELPQLINVLRGDMSLVGPRPHAVNMRTEERLGHEIIEAYPHRHRVRPGMTGWAQVCGSRGATETIEQLRRRVQLDIHYIENWSILFDVKILIMTAWVVLRGTNAR